MIQLAEALFMTLNVRLFSVGMRLYLESGCYCIIYMTYPNLTPGHPFKTFNFTQTTDIRFKPSWTYGIKLWGSIESSN